MKNFNQNVKIKEIKNDLFNSKKIQVFIKREDLIHDFISGNKYRKLKYNINNAVLYYNQILSFGGAHSNHLYSLSYLGLINKIKTIGVVRGNTLTPTIKYCKSNNMKIVNLNYSDYRDRYKKNTIDMLRDKFGDFFYLPEGGTNEMAVKGCEEIIDERCYSFDYVCCCVGTGGTVSGILRSVKQHQKVIGFSVLKKNTSILENICKYSKINNFSLNENYSFGGIGKYNVDLINFMNYFFQHYDIKLDHIYNSKMFFGVFDLAKKNFFKKNSKILVLNTGGLNGLSGLNDNNLLYV